MKRVVFGRPSFLLSEEMVGVYPWSFLDLRPTMIDYDLDLLRKVASDPALRDAFSHRHAELIELLTQFKLKPPAMLGPCPLMSVIHGVEATVFDNGPKNKRCVSRYKISFQAWTRDPGEFTKPADWKATVALKPTEAPPRVRDRRPDAMIALERLYAKANSLINPVSIDDVAALGGLCGGSLTHAYLAHQDGDGMVYLNGHFGLARIVQQEVKAMILVTPNFILEMPTASTKDAAGRPLKGKALAQSRFGRTDRLARGWASGRNASVSYSDD